MSDATAVRELAAQTWSEVVGHQVVWPTPFGYVTREVGVLAVGLLLYLSLGLLIFIAVRLAEEQPAADSPGAGEDGASAARPVVPATAPAAWADDPAVAAFARPGAAALFERVLLSAVAGEPGPPAPADATAVATDRQLDPRRLAFARWLVEHGRLAG